MAGDADATLLAGAAVVLADDVSLDEAVGEHPVAQRPTNSMTMTKRFIAHSGADVEVG